MLLEVVGAVEAVLLEEVGVGTLCSLARAATPPSVRRR